MARRPPSASPAGAWRALAELVSNRFSALHYEPHALKLGDVGERITGGRDEIRELSFADRTNLGLPSQCLCVDDGARLNGSGRTHARTFDKRFEFERLRTMRERRAVDAAADQDLEPFGGHGPLDGLVEDWNHPVLAAGVLGVVVVHVWLGVPDQR